MVNFPPARLYPKFLLILSIALFSCVSPEELPNAVSTSTSTHTSSSMSGVATPSGTPSPQPEVFGEWSDAPAMLTPRSAHAVAASDTLIFALAGTDDKGAPVLDVEVFDGIKWKLETTLPGEGLNAPTASVVGQRLYVIGGFFATSNTPSNEVYVYDIAAKTWSMAAPLLNPRGGHAASVSNGEIHLFGGGNSVSTLADHSAYNPSTDSWRDLAPLPRAEGSPAAVDVNGKIFVIGGRSGYSDFGDVYIYEPMNDSWGVGPAIDPRGTAGAVLYCDGIYLFGGESQTRRKNLEDVFRLDLDGNVWKIVSPMPVARKFARAVNFKDSVYIVGGSVVPANSHSPVGSASVLRYSQPGCGGFE